MKRIIIISLLAFVAFAVNAQVENFSFTDDTCYSDTVTFTTKYTIQKYEGSILIGFVADTSSTSGTAPTARFLGYDGLNWHPIDSAVNAQGTNYFSESPPKFLKYRLYIPGASGDTAIYQNVQSLYKRP